MACPSPWGTGQHVGDGTEGHKAGEHPAVVLIGTEMGDLGTTRTSPSHRDRVGQGAQDVGVLGGDIPGGRSWGQDSPGTCVSGGRQRIVPHPARCSSPCLARAGPQPLRPHGPRVPSTPRPSHGDRGDPRGWVTQRWGHGHSLFNLLRTLLAIFLISVVSCSRSSLVSVG